MRTRRVAAIEALAFRGELQTAGVRGIQAAARGRGSALGGVTRQ
jgi:hypothetical protein